MLIDLESRGGSSPLREEWKDRSAAEAIDFLKSTHHIFVRKQIPAIGELIRECRGQCNNREGKAGALLRFFESLADELLAHLEKEERELFPAIRSLLAGDSSVLVRATVRELEMQHSKMMGEGLMEKQWPVLTALLPDEACDRAREIRLKLEIFQEDLARHIEFENQVLFPKALELEKP